MTHSRDSPSLIVICDCLRTTIVHATMKIINTDHRSAALYTHYYLSECQHCGKTRHYNVIEREVAT